MEIVDCKHNVRCELGACRAKAEHAIKFDRVGIRSGIFVCGKCLNELYAAIGARIVPRSVETAKRRGRRGGDEA